MVPHSLFYWTTELDTVVCMVVVFCMVTLLVCISQPALCLSSCVSSQNTGHWAMTWTAAETASVTLEEHWTTSECSSESSQQSLLQLRGPFKTIVRWMSAQNTSWCTQRDKSKRKNVIFLSKLIHADPAKKFCESTLTTGKISSALFSELGPLNTYFAALFDMFGTHNHLSQSVTTSAVSA